MSARSSLMPWRFLESVVLENLGDDAAQSLLGCYLLCWKPPEKSLLLDLYRDDTHYHYYKACVR